MAKERGISRSLFRLAMKTETDGAAFYQELADHAKAPLAKEMFLSFVKDEHRHLAVVKSLFEGSAPSLAARKFRPGMPARRLHTVFEKHKQRKGERVPALASDVDALLVALEMEKESFQLYRTEGRKVTVAAEKKILDRLAMEENEHYEILSNTILYLTDSGNWFIYKDHAIMDGG